jgi:hypothetical protein
MVHEPPNFLTLRQDLPVSGIGAVAETRRRLTMRPRLRINQLLQCTMARTAMSNFRFAENIFEARADAEFLGCTTAVVL